MLFVGLAIAVIIVFAVQSRIYARRALESLTYSSHADRSEVTEGEEFYLWEEIANAKTLPLPQLRADTDLPRGLSFVFFADDNKGSFCRELSQSTKSVFSLRGEDMIRRRWRIEANKRGVYSIDDILIIAGDIFGTNSISRRLETDRYARITVLPRPSDLEQDFGNANMQSGENPVDRGLITDPMMRAGVREYTTSDPISSIDWKTSARLGSLAVFVNEYIERECFTVVMNMQSRSYEPNANEPTTTDFIEMNISVAASIIDRLSGNDIPVRFITNTPPETLGGYSAGTDEVGRKLLMTEEFCGHADTLAALRMLAALEMKISARADDMFSYLTENPEICGGGRTLIVITAYLDDRMVEFSHAMKSEGIRTVFYLTTTLRHTDSIPDGVELRYKLY